VPRPTFVIKDKTNDDQL